MTKSIVLVCMLGILTVLAAFDQPLNNAYTALYHSKIKQFELQQLDLLKRIESSNLTSTYDRGIISTQIGLARDKMKGIDIWLRYLDPIAYKKINGPLPIEWETEVFEKFEKPYKRTGAGLSLATLYLQEPEVEKDSLIQLIKSSILATRSYQADSTILPLTKFPHFFLCNRLYLLNLAAIYTTGFECPDTQSIIPELIAMMAGVEDIYNAYGESFPNTPLTENYLTLYKEALLFVHQQPTDYTQFDHYTFIKDYVNPLFALNQNLIRQYEVYSGSFVDYTLNNEATSIFNKNLYYGQNAKGIFLRVKDEKILAEIDRIGKLLFYDPILSANNKRSCVSCHIPSEYFTDTTRTTALQYNQLDFLPRNTPSLINVEYNHLLMLDGKHISLQNQVKAVVANPIELASDQAEILKKVLSCAEYKNAFTALLPQTPQEKEITFEHIAGALTTYYTKFSYAYSPFDEAIRMQKPLAPAVTHGFNLFMSKAQCATCHFVPQFNGVKPPYIGSEFEVLGVPENKDFTAISPDKGRYEINPALETLHAFRTGSIRNSAHTMPYMHNGAFSTLEEVLDFYDAGGGLGKGLRVENQTLSSDSLHLSVQEKSDLLAFIRALDEKIPFEAPPDKLPASKIKSLNNRKVGGEY